MPTIGWNNTAFTQTPGPCVFRDFIVSISAEHIDRWREDPDGRFKLRITSETRRTAEPERFYPSL